jgi:RNA polymerase sigma-70 factor (ECF subfamily)
VLVISEQQLLQRAQHLERYALGAIYDQYSPRLFRYAARLLNNADLAEECVAEVFSRFLHALEAGNGPKEHLQAYLYRIAHNWITDYWRVKPPPFDELDEQIASDAKNDPLSIFVRQIEHTQVREALAHLTPEQRHVIVLKFVEGLDNEEIAAALHKPVGAIKSLQHRAIGALRRHLMKEEITYESA